MKKAFKKLKSLIFFRKKEPWYKRCVKKFISILDMKRKNKFIVFFGLLFIGLYLSFPPLESIVKQAVHEYGSKVTKTNVSINGLKFKPTSGYAMVKGIEIGNPKEYKSKNLFYLAKLSVQIDISTLTDDIIIIDTIEIKQPKITYEMLSLTKNNISDILNNIQNSSTSTEKKQIKTENKSTNVQKTASKKVIIKNLIVQDGVIGMMAGVGKLKKEITLPLPTINLHNIGQEKQGITIKDTINLIISKILNLATDTIVSQNLENLKETTNQELQNLTSSLKYEAGATKDKIKDGLKKLIKI